MIHGRFAGHSETVVIVIHVVHADFGIPHGKRSLELNTPSTVQIESCKTWQARNLSDVMAGQVPICCLAQWRRSPVIESYWNR